MSAGIPIQKVPNLIKDKSAYSTPSANPNKINQKKTTLRTTMVKLLKNKNTENSYKKITPCIPGKRFK